MIYLLFLSLLSQLLVVSNLPNYIGQKYLIQVDITCSILVTVMRSDLSYWPKIWGIGPRICFEFIPSRRIFFPKIFNVSNLILLLMVGLCLLCHRLLKYHNYSVCVCTCSVMSNSLWPHGLYPAKLLCPWGFPGKSTGLGCISYSILITVAVV